MPEVKLAGADDYRACAKSTLSAAIRELLSAHTFATRAGMDDLIRIEIDHLLERARAMRSRMEQL